ncbi:TetR/AcrR family transcriptional regulator [Streptomyces alkaliphilus]|uniref:TetR family transcriptional regulator n=1 Tax=Streptomyces alkaliphilus TaxID=1472722 RepID=A0A7W3Y2S6_9ACTN|nr:TetR/AcrR family transcriptional regulator [Streptomyces alkaliphilus]MBB0245726.1 TetR family transcriptional regulator [Streptomyces alkaliphilus]MQS09119.1 TetR family transcriptional regulator [Streptomyces alkaliphilus]
MTEKTRRRLPRAVREEQIVDAALEVFSQRGYHAAAVDEICERAGISKPMVYLYLGSKEAVFVACVRRESERLVATLREAAHTGDTPEARLWAGLEAFFRFVTDHRDGWVVLHRHAADLGETVAGEIDRARRAIMAEVTRLVRDGIALVGEPGTPATRLGEEDAEFVGHALVGAADSLTDWMERHPRRSAEDTALRMMNMVWIGMRQVLGGEVWTPPGRR